MAKCIKSPDGKTILRTSNQEAEERVKNEGFAYVPKSVWQRYLQDTKKER